MEVRVDSGHCLMPAIEAQPSANQKNCIRPDLLLTPSAEQEENRKHTSSRIYCAGATGIGVKAPVTSNTIDDSLIRKAIRSTGRMSDYFGQAYTAELLKVARSSSR